MTSGARAARPGLGTLGMQERVAPPEGRLVIRSRPGRVAVLLASLPIDQPAAATGDQPSSADRRLQRRTEPDRA